VRLESPTGTLEIVLEGNTIVITDYAKKKPVVTRRKFLTAAQANAQLPKLLAEKRSQGYTEVVAPAEHWPAPDDLEDLSVAFDALQRSGDPRGAIGAMQIALSKGSDVVAPCLAAIKEHAARVFGDLAKHVTYTVHGRGELVKKPIMIDFRLGYINSVTLAGTAKMPLVTAYEALRANPLARHLRSLTIGVASTVSPTFHYYDLATAIAKHGRFEQLRRLELGAVPNIPTWRINLGDLTGALPPGLVELSLRGVKLKLDALPASLKSLEIEGAISAALRDQIGLAACKLDRLSLRSVSGSRLSLARVATAAVAHPLQQLRLNGFDGENALGLFEVADRLNRIENVNLAGNAIPAELLPAVAQRFDNAELHPQAHVADVEDRFAAFRE
jgi:hypothetical protein